MIDTFSCVLLSFYEALSNDTPLDNSCTTTVKHNFSILLGEVEDRQVDSLSVIANNSIHRWAVVWSSGQRVGLLLQQSEFDSL